jgi:RsiW-degrading membrane proteinase PrsW (M82 family)
VSRIRTIVATDILLVLGLLAFVGVAYSVELVGGLGDAIRLSPIAGVAFSAIPAGLWLTYFYAQDRHEPEPKLFVLGVFLLGGFVAGPLSAFIIEDVMAIGEATSLDRFGADRLLRAFLVVGVTQELCKYIVVRYTIYLSAEFDEPMDGIIYMTAAGIGFATYVNIDYFGALGGHVLLTTAAGHAVVTTLAHACFAGVLGYALGRAKFSKAAPPMRGLTLLAGLLMAALLNGQFDLLSDVVKGSGMKLHPWRGVAYTAGFAAIVFFVISILMRRLLDISPFRPEVVAVAEAAVGEGNGPVILSERSESKEGEGEGDDNGEGEGDDNGEGEGEEEKA